MTLLKIESVLFFLLGLVCFIHPSPCMSGVLSDYISDNWDGVKLTAMGGEAEITSHVTRPGGTKEEVANGTQGYYGVELSLENKDVEKGFSWLIYPRMMHQNINISDFREEVRYLSTPDTLNIDYIVTDYETGETVDPLDPNIYAISMTAAGFAIRGQYQINSLDRSYMWDDKIRDRFVWYLSASLGANLLEVNQMEVELGSKTVVDSRVGCVNAVSAGVTTGVMITRFNIKFELDAMTTAYPSLTLPEKAEFRDKYILNPEKEVYERDRLFLDEVSLIISTIRLSVVCFF